MPDLECSLKDLAKDGIARPYHLEGRLPSDERRRQGAYAVIECFQEIPCDPCVTSCRFNAIRPFQDINDLPFVIFENCNGCGVCAAKCPGLAIFIVDESKSEDLATILLPYEYSPLPEKGEMVMALNRQGEDVQKVPVVQVRSGKHIGTPMVAIEISKTQLFDVRALRRLTAEVFDVPVTKDSFTVSEYKCEIAKDVACSAADDNEIVVCRCEGVTMAEIRGQIRRGATTVDEVKHRTRSGMGPCQGRSCRQIILAEIARFEGVSPEELDSGSYRQPLRPVALGLLADMEAEDGQ
jgi:Fe-S-cluster-containing hydrogenase component 2